MHKPPRTLKRIRLVIIDPNPICRLGMQTLLSGVGEFQVVGEGDSVSQAKTLGVFHKPTVLLCTMELLRHEDVGHFQTLSKQNPEINILLLLPRLDDSTIQRALQTGAKGIAKKTCSPHALIRGIKSVALGKYWQDSQISTALVQKLRQSKSNAIGTNQLSRREAQVLALVAKGQTNKQIGQSLGVTEKTIKNYLASIFQKLHVTRRAQAAAIFVRYEANYE